MPLPKSHYLYKFFYTEWLPELAGIVFYVGKGTNTDRMNAHLFIEAQKGMR